MTVKQNLHKKVLKNYIKRNFYQTLNLAVDNCRN